MSVMDRNHSSWQAPSDAQRALRIIPWVGIKLGTLGNYSATFNTEYSVAAFVDKLMPVLMRLSYDLTA